MDSRREMTAFLFQVDCGSKEAVILQVCRVRDGICVWIFAAGDPCVAKATHEPAASEPDST